jgi:hypothetical protein
VLCPSDDRFKGNVFTTFYSHVVGQSRTYSRSTCLWKELLLVDIQRVRLTARGSRETVLCFMGSYSSFSARPFLEDPRTLNKVVPRESNAGRRVALTSSIVRIDMGDGSTTRSGMW